MIAHAAERWTHRPSAPNVARYAHSRGTPGRMPRSTGDGWNQPTARARSRSNAEPSARAASIAPAVATAATSHSHSDSVATYFYVVPYFPHVGANELPRVYLVKSIVEDHTFTIEKNVTRFGWTRDHAEWNGHTYSNKAPGSSLLVVPVYAAVHAIAGEPSFGVVVWLCRVVTGVIPSLLFLWLLWGFLARFAPEPEIRRLVLV